MFQKLRRAPRAREGVGKSIDDPSSGVLAEARASSLHRRSGHRNFLARFLERARANDARRVSGARPRRVFCPAIQPAGRRPQWVEPSVVIARRPRGID
tara:strand:- start:6633 stop:6926 length:294 start_codon:yes stop_codon:yes gene_type:complete